MKKLNFKKVLSGGLAIAIAVGVGWGVTSKIQEGNLIDKDYETASITRRLKPVSAKDAKLSVYGETLPEGVEIKASDVNFEIISDSFSGEKTTSFENAAASVLKESDIAFAYDIDLKHQLKAGEEVEVTIDNLKINNPKAFKVLHIKDNGEKEIIIPTYADYTKVKFKTTSFSFYAGYDSTPMQLVVEVPAGQTINLPLTGTVDVAIDWGDETIDGPITTEKPEHTYSKAGTYTIQIAGTATTFGTTGETEDGTNLKDYLIKIESLGDLSCTRYGFYNYKFTEVNAGEGSNLYTATDLSNMFYNCLNLTTVDFTHANTTNATDMSNMFKNCVELEKIYVGSTWSTENVTNSTDMFYNAPNLKGGYGTSYDKNQVTATYAVIDSKTTPGYLNTKTAYQLFNGASVIGNYETLQEAITAVNESGLNNLELVMLTDKVETEAATLTNGKTLTLSLEDKTLKIDSANILVVSGNLTVQANNGGMVLNAENAFVGTSGSTINLENVLVKMSASAIFTKGNLNASRTEIITNGDAITLDTTGTLVAEETNITAKGSAITSLSTWTSNITLKSGTYASESSSYVLNLDGSGTLVIGDSSDAVTKDEPTIIGKNGIAYDGAIEMYDGTVKVTETEIEGSVSNKPSGYVLVAGTEIVDSTEYKTLYLGKGVYQVESNYYETLENAINNATTGSTIKVINDAVDSSEPSIPVTKNITLNTNGKTIELDSNSLEVLGGLTINGNGTIETYKAMPAIINSGVLEIDNATITGGTYGVVTSANVTFTSGRIQGVTDTFKLNNSAKVIVPEGSEIAYSSDSNYKIASIVTLAYDYAGTIYSDFQSAYEAAVNLGDTEILITAISDRIIDTSTINIASGRSVTLDTVNSEITFKNAINIAGVLTITGDGQITGDTYGINKTGTGKLIIQGPVLIGETYGVQSTTSIYLNAGSIRGKTNATNLLNSSAEVIVPEGYTLNISKSELTGYETAEAYIGYYMIGTDSYSTLADAVAAAQTGETIRLMQTVNDYSEPIVSGDKHLKLDLNGKSLMKRTFPITVYGGLEVFGEGGLIERVEKGETLFENFGNISLDIFMGRSTGVFANNNSETASIHFINGTFSSSKEMIHSDFDSEIIIGCSGDKYADSDSLRLDAGTIVVDTVGGFEFYDGMLNGTNGVYTGTVEKTEKYHIVVGSGTSDNGYTQAYLRKDISHAVVDESDRVYEGKSFVESIFAKDPTDLVNMLEGTDYTFEIDDQYSVGTRTVTLTGKGNYTGTKTFSFAVLPKEIEVEWIGPYDFLYDGSAHAPEYSVNNTWGEETLTFTRTTAVEAGTHTSTVTIMSVSGGLARPGNYKLINNTVEFTISKAEDELTVSEQVITLYKGESKTITYSFPNFPSMTYKVDDTNVAAVTAIDNLQKTITIKANSAGVTSVELTAAETMYSQSASTTFFVVVLQAAYTDGTNFYDTFANAVTNAATGSKITLLEDVTETSAVTVPSGKILRFNLNEHTITLNSLTTYIANAGTLYILNEEAATTDIPGGAPESDGILNTGYIVGDSINTIVNNTGSLYLQENVILRSKNSVIVNKSTLSVSGATIINLSNAHATIQNANTGTINISKGTIEGQHMGIENAGSFYLSSTNGRIDINATTAIKNTVAGAGTIRGQASSDTYVYITGTILNESTGTIEIEEAILNAMTAIQSSNGIINLTSSKIDASVAIKTTNSAAKVNVYTTNITTTSTTIDAAAGTINLNSSTNIESSAKCIVNTNATININGGSTIKSAKTAIESTGTIVVDTSTIEATGSDTAIVITGGSFDARSATLKAASNTLLENEGTVSLDASTITANGTTSIEAIKNNGTLTLNAGTMNASGRAINNTNILNIFDLAQINSYTGIINTGSLTVGVNDGVVGREPKIHSSYTAIENNGVFNWYDGELKGRSETVYIGTDAELPAGMATKYEISGQEKTIYLVQDTAEPEITSLITQNDWTIGSVTIEVVATDDVAVTYYGISTSASTQPTEWQTTPVFTVTENARYYLWVKDGANNVVYRGITITYICSGIWDTTGTTGGRTRAVLTLDGILIFQVTDRSTGANTSATGYIKGYTSEGAPWIEENITAVEVHQGILGLGEYSLAFLPDVETISIIAALNSIADTTFVKTNNYNSVSIGAECTILKASNYKIYNAASTKLYAYSTVNINRNYAMENTVVSIAPYAFYNNTALTTLTTNKYLTSIGEKAFEGVTGIVYYYTSCTAMKNYVEANSDEANFVPLDDVAPVINAFVLNNEAATTSNRDVTFVISATDDTGLAKMYITEDNVTDAFVEALDETVWSDYTNSGIFTLSETENVEKTVYVWVKDAAGNISNKGTDSIFYAITNASIKGSLNIVQYVDSTNKDYYAYDEEVQGGYTADEDTTVEVSGTVDHENIGTYSITYKVYVSGTLVETHIRNIDVISNTWGTTTNTQDGYQYVIHENGKYAKIVGYTGTKNSSMIIPPVVMNSNTQLTVIDVGANIFASETEPDNTISKITLPNTLINIGENAFAGCTELRIINFPDSLMRIQSNAFSMAGSNVGYNVTLPANTRQIAARAFYNSYVKSFVAGTLLREIGDEAFSKTYNTSTIEIEIPKNLEVLGEKVFSSMKISSISVAEGNTNFKLSTDEKYLTNILGDELIVYTTGSSDVSYKVPDEITTIKSGAFASSTNLKTIDLNKVEKISEDAFKAAGLTHVIIPEGVVTIESGAFSEMSNLTVIILMGTTSVFDDAFYGNNNLQGLIFTSTKDIVAIASENAIPTNAKLYVPEVLLSAYKADSMYAAIPDLDAIVKLIGLTYQDWMLNVPYIEQGAVVFGETFTESGASNVITGTVLEINGIVNERYSARYLLTYTVKFGDLELGSVTRVVDVADFEAPTITGFETETFWVEGKQTFTITATDNISLGGYLIKDVKEETLASEDGWQESNVFEVTENKTYYVYAKDGHGNVSEAYEIKAEWICLRKWDVSLAGDGSLAGIIPLEDNTKFIVSGTGNTKDYEETEVPWYNDTTLSTITTVVVEDGVTYIGKHILSNFDKVTSISLPSTVTSISSSAFMNTNNFDVLNINGNTRLVTDGYTLYDSAKKILYVHSNKSTSVFTLPTSVEEIGAGALMNNGAISVMDLSNVKTINDRAFNNTIHISELYVPKTLTSIGANVFAGMTGTIYYYSSCSEMVNYVKTYGTEATFEMIDDIKPVVTEVKINGGDQGTQDREVELTINAYDDVKITHILIEETLSNSITDTDVRWQAYDNSGLVGYTLSEGNGDKIVYVWAKDAAGNVSEIPGQDNIFLGTFNFNLKGSETVIMYVDTTGKNYYQYNEEVQGGYEVLAENMDVVITDNIDETKIGTYTINYSLIGNGTTMGTYSRNVKVIANSWGNTVYTSGQFKYVKHATENYAKVVAYTGIDIDVTVPGAFVDNGTAYTVIDIESQDVNGVFYPVDITSVTLPDTVINIGKNTFRNLTNMTYIDLPGSVQRIEDSAFSNAGLRELILPDNVRVVEESAFQDNNITSNLQLGSLIKMLEYDAFANVGTVDEVVIPATIDDIDEGAFAMSRISKFSIDGTTSKYSVHDDKYLIETEDSKNTIIGAAISALSVEETIDGITIDRIGAYTFAKATKLQKLNITACEEIGEAAFMGSGLVEFTVPANTKLIDYEAFKSCGSLETIVVEGGPEIFANAFDSDEILTRLVLINESEYATISPDSGTLLENINIYAFKDEEYRNSDNWIRYADRIYPIFYISGDTYVEMQAGDEYIEEGAVLIGELFKTSGTSTVITSLGVTITDNIDNKSIGNYEVKYTLTSRGTEVASVVRKVKVLDTAPPTITEIRTENVPQVGQEKVTVYAKDNVAVDRFAITSTSEIPDMSSNIWTTSNVLYATSNGTWYVWVRDLDHNVAMQTVEIKNICQAMWDIGTVPETVYAVLDDANKLIIRGEGSVKDFTLETLPWNDKFTSIVAIEVWDGVTSLGEYTLANLSYVQSIKLAATLETIEYTSFANTNYFSIVEIDENNTNFVYENGSIYTASKDVLYVHTNQDTTAEITIDDNVTVIANYAFANNENLQKVVLHENIEISDGAFYNAKNLVTVEGQVDTVRLGAYAFAGCAKLSEISLSNDIEIIGSYAFDGCSSITTLNLDTLVSLSTLEHHALANLHNIYELTVPSSIIEIASDENGNKNIFENLGKNYGSNAIVYYYDSCIVMGKYASETPDANVDFIEKDTTGPTLVSLEVVNLTSGNYAAGTQIKIEATFSEECDYDKSTFPVLEIKIGDGDVKTLIGVAGRKSVTYTYTVELEDEGQLAAVSFVGTVYDMLGKFTSFTEAELTGPEIFIKTTVKVTTGADGEKYYSSLNEALTKTSGTAEFEMLLDDKLTSGIEVTESDEYTLNLNNKVVEFNVESDNMLITNRGKFTINDTGTLSIKGKGQLYGVMNHGEFRMNYSTINVNSIEGVTYGIYNFEDGFVYAKDAEVISTAGDGESNGYGIYNEGSIYIENSKVTGTTLKNRTYGIYTKGECNIIAGEISGRLLEETTGGVAYGVYNVTGKTTIGRNDATMSIDTPYIYGSVEGVRNVGGTLEFYDGSIEGYLYNSIISSDVKTLTGYAVVKTIVGTREYATLGIDTEGPVVTVTKDPVARWTNDKVVVTLEVYDEKSGVKSVTFDGIEVKLENGIGTINVTQNGTYTVKAEDNANNLTTEVVEVKNVDTASPIIYSASLAEASEKGEAVVKLVVEDGESGINGYAINTKSDTPTEWKTVTTTTEISTINISIGENGEYYVFVRDVAGNITRHSSVVKVVSVDSSEPEIESVKVETTSEGFVNSSTVIIKVDAQDDIGVTELLLSNELLTVNEVANSEDWVPYTKEVLWRIPEEDKEHVVYVWARDAVGRTSSYGMVRMKLLTQYVGNGGINQTSLKILFQDNNYNFDSVLDKSDIRIQVKDLEGNITYDGVYGGNITIKGEPVIYGPIMQGTEVIGGRYYTIIAENTLGNGTIYLGIKTSAERDKAGNSLGEGSEYLVATDITVDNSAPKITVTNTEVQIKDDDGNGTGYIKINDKTVKLSSGKISRQALITLYDIELVTGTIIEASDKCGNTTTYTVY